MAAKNSIWLLTASALALAAVPAAAQQQQTQPNVTVVQPDGAAEQAGEAVDNAATATGNAAQGAAATVGQATAPVTAQGEDPAVAQTDAINNTTQRTPDAATTATETTEVEVETTDEAEVAEGTPVEGQIFEQSADQYLASTLMDGTVTNPAGEEIGGVSDMIMTRDGNVTGVVIGVGGFLGIGQKNVAIELDRIEMTEGEDGEFTFVLNATQEELEAAPEFMTQEESQQEQEANAAAQTGGTPTGGAAGTTTPAAPATAN